VNPDEPHWLDLLIAADHQARANGVDLDGDEWANEPYPPRRRLSETTFSQSPSPGTSGTGPAGVVSGAYGVQT
jgi:hypothetical protein